MTLIALGILGFTVIVLIIGIIFVTVTFSRALQKSLEHADRVHDRVRGQLDSVLDRLMSKDFTDFKVYDLGERRDPEEVELPATQEDRPWDVPAVFVPGKGLAGGNKNIEVEEEP